MPHAFYACMGGYRVVIPRAFLNEDGDTRDDPTLIAGTAQGDNEHYQVLVKDTMVEKTLCYSPQLTTLEILDELGLFLATEEACLQDRGLSLMKEEDIHNVSTSDAVIKGFALFSMRMAYQFGHHACSCGSAHKRA
ncbi:uncharacterized protein BO88DRAFT_414084 [Aspergillus vadensis CBS 113365]|uniref:Uncharacterized protein n=1 Tax=Aspergillus vadensis (strain CBS 113365 / IMI 142717 / IBT 24658) TaxID=1448311 RepID=A0A319BEB3_ASPVC|nr:hypothetical protein BO88DRAFT_414084 [Aspergillus vadensis CBS 113365]PYH70344.1 hypothetical protein BO88DRAFT_414084 [Aspergillus vadensis CBS 113365]